MPRFAIPGSLAVFALAASLWASPITAPIVPPRGYVCTRAGGPVRIDGIVDEEEWKAAPWTDEFLDIQGPTQPKARLPHARPHALGRRPIFYFAAQMEEPHVSATFTEHDSHIWREDNDFEIFIDPNSDNVEYYELEINARNTVWDLFLPPAVQGRSVAAPLLGDPRPPDGGARRRHAERSLRYRSRLVRGARDPMGRPARGRRIGGHRRWTATSGA